MAYWFLIFVLAGQDAAAPSANNGWRLQPAPPPLFLFDRDPPAPAATVDRWLTELGADDFDTRERAEDALVGQGKAVLPRLRRAALTATDLEARRRINAVLDAHATRVFEPDECPSIFQLIGTNGVSYIAPPATPAVHALRWLGVRDRALTELPAYWRQPAYHLAVVAAYYHTVALRQFGITDWCYASDAERLATHMLFRDLAAAGVNPEFVRWLRDDMARRTNPPLPPAAHPPFWLLNMALRRP